jgi:transcriptional regulator with GAF, ATPase, and Fis domain
LPNTSLTQQSINQEIPFYKELTVSYLLSKDFCAEIIKNTCSLSDNELLTFLEWSLSNELLIKSSSNLLSCNCSLEHIQKNIIYVNIFELSAVLIEQICLNSNKENSLIEITIYRLSDLIGPKEVILILKKLAFKYYQQKKITKSIRYFYSCLAFSKSFSLHEDFILFAIYLSKLELLISPNHLNTINLQIEALKMAQSANNTRMEALLNLYAGLSYFFMGSESEGLTLMEKGWQQIKELNDSFLNTESIPAVGWYLYLQGKFKEAIKHYEKYILGIKEKSNPDVSFISYPPIIYSYIFLGEFHQAIILTILLRKQAINDDNFSIAATMRCIEGGIYLYLRNIEHGGNLLYKAYEETKQENNAFGHYFTLYNLSHLHYLQDNLKAARETLIIAREYADKIGIGRMYASPFVLDILYKIKKDKLPPINNLELDNEITINKNGFNIHLKGVSYRYEALEKIAKGYEYNKIIDLLIKSKGLLEQSGNSIEIAKTNIELSRIYLKMKDKKNAQYYAVLAWYNLGSYVDIYFPNELISLVNNLEPQVNLASSLKTLWMKYRNITSLEKLAAILFELNRIFEVESGAYFTLNKSNLDLRISQNILDQNKCSAKNQKIISLINYTIEQKKVITIFKSRRYTAKYNIDIDDEPLFILCIPLISKNISIGAFYHESYYRNTDLNDDDKQVIYEFAENYASHLDSILSYERLEIETARLSEQNKHLQNSKQKHELVFHDTVLKNIYENLKIVAKASVPVLFTGETGVGKEVYANKLYEMSTNTGPFIKVNCGAIPVSIMESELFGYEKGAFTGANQTKKGYFELANNGTLLLDEIGELSMQSQVILLRVLQEHEIQRVGGISPIKVNFRLIAATNKDLLKEVELGNFRRDLYYRLSIFPIHIPPLRERKTDILPLANYFIKKYCEALSKPIPILGQDQIVKLLDYPWTGNVRELENVIQRAIILCKDSHLIIPTLVSHSHNNKEELCTLEVMERKHIIQVLKHTNGKIGGPDGAAKILGLKRTTLISKMKKLGLS